MTTNDTQDAKMNPMALAEQFDIEIEELIAELGRVNEIEGDNLNQAMMFRAKAETAERLALILRTVAILITIRDMPTTCPNCGYDLVNDNHSGGHNRKKQYFEKRKVEVRTNRVDIEA